MRSQRNTWSSSAGSANSTNARGKTRSTSGTSATLRSVVALPMRLGVLDIGSNTGHLLVVDAHGGAAPLPASSHKQPLRLAEHLDDDGAVTKKGIEALTDFVAAALGDRRGQGLRGDARLRDLRGARRRQLRRRARARREAQRREASRCSPARTRRG